MSTFKTSDGAIFVQLDGPNTPLAYIGCADMDELSATGGAINEILRCFNDGGGWNTLDYTRTPPDPVTTSITIQLEAAEHLLEQAQDCAFPFYVLMRQGGKAGQPTNYQRLFALGDAILGNNGLQNLVMRENEQFSTQSFAISALPPLLRSYKKFTSRLSIGSGFALNGLSFCNSARCATATGPAQRACKIGFTAGQAESTESAIVWYTTDYGQTWTATDANPFAADEHIAAVTCFEIEDGVTRVIVARGVTDADDPAEVAYSDDFGATWTAVDIGETDALFVLSPNGLFAIDQFDVWAVTGGGFVHHSTDGGVSWSTAHAGTITTQNLHSVHFANDKVGVAAGAAGAVLKTQDGGLTWSLMTAPANTIIRKVFVIDGQNMWAAGSDGNLYYTHDGGATWAVRAFTGSGAGAVRDVAFSNRLFGYMIHNDAGGDATTYYTYNGGYIWERVNTVDNSGLSQLAVCGLNEWYAAGAVDGGTAVIMKAQPQRI